MDKVFQRNAAIVLSVLTERGYSEKSIKSYDAIFKAMSGFLEAKDLLYTPSLGDRLAEENADEFFGVKGYFIRAASIAKLNSVYNTGMLTGSLMSPRRPYQKVILLKPMALSVQDYLSHCNAYFSAEQIKNVRRRITLFLKQMQSLGRRSPEEIIYSDIGAFHIGLSHMKRICRVVEESSVHQFLQYLADSGIIKPGLYYYLYVLETDQLISLEDFSQEAQKNILVGQDNTSLSDAEIFRQKGMEVVERLRSSGYVEDYLSGMIRTIMHVYLFLDLHEIRYTTSMAHEWLRAERVRTVFTGSSLASSRRFLWLMNEYLFSGRLRLTKTMDRGISGLTELPDWCKEPLLKYADLRRREKLEEETVKNDIWSVLRLCRFILSKGIASYSAITSDTLLQFNLWDAHGSSEGKAACNARIRKFLQFLCREGYVDSPSLYKALGYCAAPSESIVVILNDNELEQAENYISSATTPLAMRDSAIILLGTEMGIRGCDIVNLKCSDINWKDQTIRFTQEKTDTEVILAMPVSVGNAIYRYIKSARPQNSGYDFLFLNLRAPYGKLTRHACYSALHRIIPERNVEGSGFHVTRKTFSTNRLRNGVSPQMIADAIGHADKKTLTPYLSLDDDRMAFCPLSLSELGIPLTMKGGLQ